MTALPYDFDQDLISRFDRSGPRYTSYPTADRFTDAFGPASYRACIARRNAGGIDRSIALYLHLPFCRDICFYCACNKIVTRDRAKTGRYLDYMRREIAVQGELFGHDRRVGEMHWGGGTPTYYDAAELRALWRAVADHFELAPDGEYAIEIDPRTVDGESIAALRDIGFNRVSFGVQDFDLAVQQAVHRLQSEAQTMDSIAAARRAGFGSVNIDLIYGLPKQTPQTFDATLARVLTARPDRIALYNYAHLPTVFKSQRRIAMEDMPRAETKLALMALAVERLGAEGYAFIGMDHFALPGDSLAVAQRQGRLRRGFQGYTAGADLDLVGLGVSAIGAVGPAYSQNFRTLEDYYRLLDQDEPPVMRGLELGHDDLVRRAVIQDLMCNFAVSTESVALSYLIDFEYYFATELAEMREFEDLGLVAREPGWLTVTPKGRFLVRRICMVFDRYLRQSTAERRYSRVI